MLLVAVSGHLYKTDNLEQKATHATVTTTSPSHFWHCSETEQHRSSPLPQLPQQLLNPCGTSYDHIAPALTLGTRQAKTI